MDSNIPPQLGRASTSFSSRAQAELDAPATPSPATLFAAPLAPPDSSPFSPPQGLGDADGAPSSASSSSSSESPGGGLLPPPSTMTTSSAPRGLGMMGMAGGYADSLKILFSKPSGHEEVLSEDEARRRREQLNRRPSYRMILKDLETVDKTMKTEPEDSPPDASSSLGSTVDTTPGTSSNNLNGPGDSLHVQIPRSGLLPSTSSAQQQQLPPSNGAMGSPYASPLSNNLLLGQGSLNSMPLNGGDISLGDLQYNTQLSLITAASLANAARTSQITPTSAFEGTTGDMHSLKGMQDHSFSQGAAAGRMFDEVAAQLENNNGHLMRQQQPQQLQQNGSMNGLGGGQRGAPLTLRESLSAGGGMMGDEDEYMDRKGVDWTSSLMSSTGYSSSPSPTGGHGVSMGGEDEGTRKRQVRLLKNREAAKECRRKKKEYVKCLENRVAVLENQNKALIEELKALKELYCRKEKNDM